MNNIATSQLSEAQSTTYVAVFIIAAFLVLLAILIPYLIVKHRYMNFIKKHSVSLKELDEINKKYDFARIPCLDVSHEYDSKTFYDSISCKDYLTYELVYKQRQFKSSVFEARKNKRLFSDYTDEIKEKIALDRYDTDKLLKNLKRLKKYELKLFYEKCKRPVINFSVTVELVNVKMNGVTIDRKQKEFDETTILEIIDDLSYKRGDFYTKDYIWDSICRVERGKVTNKMRFAIYQRDHHRCRRCGRRTNDLEIDHIVPIAKGGKSTYDNLQTLCHRCNVRKGTDTKRY